MGARADDGPILSTRAFSAFPPGTALAVEPRDDTDANLHLRDLMAARLTAQQHPVVGEAKLRLRFSTETLSSAGPAPGGATSDAVMATDRQPYAATNLNYSEVDRFFSPRTDRAARAAIQNTLQLRATLETRSGQVVWSGEVHAALGERNEQRLGADLAEALADTVGRTVDSRTAAVSTPAPAPVPPQQALTTSFGALRLPGLSLPELAERR
jgi:hypothetical protein